MKNLSFFTLLTLGAAYVCIAIVMLFSEGHDGSFTQYNIIGLLMLVLPFTIVRAIDKSNQNHTTLNN